MRSKGIDEVIAELSEAGETISLPQLIEMQAKLAAAGKLGAIIKAHIINCLLAGTKIPGYKLVRARGRAGITDDKTAVDRLLDFYSKDKASGLPPISSVLAPASLGQLQKTLGTDVVADLLSGLISYDGVGKGYDFAPQTDERDEVTPTKGSNQS